MHFVPAQRAAFEKARRDRANGRRGPRFFQHRSRRSDEWWRGRDLIRLQLGKPVSYPARVDFPSVQIRRGVREHQFPARASVANDALLPCEGTVSWRGKLVFGARLQFVAENAAAAIGTDLHAPNRPAEVVSRRAVCRFVNRGEFRFVHHSKRLKRSRRASMHAAAV